MMLIATYFPGLAVVPPDSRLDPGKWVGEGLEAKWFTKICHKLDKKLKRQHHDDEATGSLISGIGF